MTNNDVTTTRFKVLGRVRAREGDGGTYQATTDAEARPSSSSPHPIPPDERLRLVAPSLAHPLLARLRKRLDDRPRKRLS